MSSVIRSKDLKIVREALKASVADGMFINEAPERLGEALDKAKDEGANPELVELCGFLLGVSVGGRLRRR